MNTMTVRPPTQPSQGTFAGTLSWLAGCEVLPRDVEDKARLLLLDTLGCLIAGLRHDDVLRFGRALTAAFPGDIAWPGCDIRLSPAGSGALGGAAACWDEACEGNAEAHGRPGLPVVPALLALGAARKSTLGALLLALATGYEIGARAGQAWRIPPGLHVDGSWHSLGVAAAAARLLSGPGTMAAAIETASCQIPGSLYLPITAGSVIRNTYVSHAVLLGLLAASAAQAGLVAPAGALEEGRRRLLRASEDASVTAPGQWTLLDGYLKPFAGVRHTHYGVEAALRIRAKHSFALADIRAIDLSIYDEATRYCGNRKPQTAIQAQFSLSYAIAAALKLGDLGPDAYGDALSDSDIMRLEDLVQVSADPRRIRRGARLSIIVGAQTFSEETSGLVGDSDRPMTRNEAIEKFHRYTEPALGAARVAAIVTFVMEGSDAQPIERLFMAEQR